MSRIKAIIFDVDGVLIDSFDANAGFYAALFEAAGYQPPNRAAIDSCFYLPVRESIERLINGHDQAEIDRIYHLGLNNLKTLYPDHLLAFPNALTPVLEKLHRQYKLAVVTSRIKAGVGPVLKRAGVDHFFDVIVTYEDYQHPKPHPQSLQVALKQLELRPPEAIYVGDGPPDIVAATAAGMPSIHLAPTTHQDATIGITGFDQIPAAVANIDHAAS